MGRVVPHAARAGLRTLAPDQRGYSPGRGQRGATHRLRELCADTVALLDAAGRRAGAIVGHDWGGGGSGR